jgi:hypothetical protein
MYHTFRSFLFVYGRSNIYTTNTAEKRRLPLFICPQSITIISNWNHLINYWYVIINYYIYGDFISLLIIAFCDGSWKIMYHLVKKFQVFSNRYSICHTCGPPYGVPNWTRSNTGINYEWRILHEPPNPMYFQSCGMGKGLSLQGLPF